MTIEASKLLKIYGRRKVVNEVSLQVGRGEVVGLLGPNGAGKTTSFYMVVGLVKPNKGSISLDGKNISKLPMYKRARLGLGYLPQEASVFRKLTVEENIIAIWQLRGGAPKLSVLELMELAVRKRERAWWYREGYYEDSLNFLNHKPIEVSDSELNYWLEGTELAPEDDKVIRNNSFLLKYLANILAVLKLDYKDVQTEVINFLIDYDKVYKHGRKKRFQDQLSLLWKIKRDQLFKEYQESEDSERKFSILSEMLEIMNVKSEVSLDACKLIPTFENVNELINFISDLEIAYWLEFKQRYLSNKETLQRLNKIKKSNAKTELVPFLEEIRFSQRQINEVIEAMNWSKKQSQKFQLEDILDEFNINHIRKSKGSDLSGGERRRVEIARAVANKPYFLLLDEPFAGIDPIAVAGIKEMIVLLKNRNIGVLITDHNVRETLKIIDRGYILSDGKVIENGTREHLANSDIARKHYLGEDFTLD